MKNFISGLVLVSCVWLFGVLDCHGQKNAQIPYRHLIKIAKEDSGSKDAESYEMKISSSITGVPPESIQLILDTKAGPKYLIVDKSGTFELPNSTMLFNENPTLHTNQPKGSVIIRFKMEGEFVPPKIVDEKISYAALFKPVIEMQTLMKKFDPTFGRVGGNQFALEIRTDKPIKISRTYLDKSGKKVEGARTFEPYKGVILLIMEKHMLEEKSDVFVPGKVKINLIPVTAQQAQRIKTSW